MGVGEESNVVAKYANAVRQKDDATKQLLASGVLLYKFECNF